MDHRSKLKLEAAAAWSGVVFIVFYPIFWLIIGKMHPPVPYSMSPEDMKDYYLSHRDGIMYGMVFSAVVGGTWLPFTAQLAVTLRRIEGEGAVFTLISILGGVLTAWALIFTPVTWMMPAMRPDADAQIIRAFHDYAYLLFKGTFVISTLQAVAHGVVGLLDRSPRKVFPAWSCWVAIAAGIGFAVAGPTPFIESGPFALDGWFAGWLPGTGFFIWTAVTTYYLILDVNQRQKGVVLE
ncbi:hypothetical protein BGZ61DRAFT_439906 [Ilyonectria robusta]|uniref:uncharacterized protein n=1 Tax=Ilyonectria robusta TaxID=1079257 RepID=UPI001E8CDCE4|nr:uncharacterized protein BGZ61DRAFT_439906 [Ilyonectria robusta]KAH8738304.1 hypothetical protein BGZ61DRAFT_439906 [Ilyonectria robusta]